MDERTLATAEAATQRHMQQARERMNGDKTYTVVVLGNNSQPFTITASSAQDREDQMVRAGINTSTDRWAAGYIDGRSKVQLCGNDDEAKRRVKQHLGRR